MQEWMPKRERDTHTIVTSFNMLLVSSCASCNYFKISRSSAYEDCNYSHVTSKYM